MEDSDSTHTEQLNIPGPSTSMQPAPECWVPGDSGRGKNGPCPEEFNHRKVWLEGAQTSSEPAVFSVAYLPWNHPCCKLNI